MKYYHGAGRRGPYFEGWYFKHQTPDGALLALIPALHIGADGARTASLQVVSDAGAWWLPYSAEALQAAEGLFQIWLDGNLMSRRGLWLDPGRAAVRAVYAPQVGHHGALPPHAGHGVPPRRGEHGPPAGGSADPQRAEH